MILKATCATSIGAENAPYVEVTAKVHSTIKKEIEGSVDPNLPTNSPRGIQLWAVGPHTQRLSSKVHPMPCLGNNDAVFMMALSPILDNNIQIYTCLIS